MAGINVMYTSKEPLSSFTYAGDDPTHVIKDRTFFYGLDPLETNVTIIQALKGLHFLIKKKLPRDHYAVLWPASSKEGKPPIFDGGSWTYAAVAAIYDLPDRFTYTGVIMVSTGVVAATSQAENVEKASLPDLLVLTNDPSAKWYKPYFDEPTSGAISTFDAFAPFGFFLTGKT
jgi:hypothetical protein